MTPEQQVMQRERQGVVVSDKMEKTIVVEVTNVKPHPQYKKIVRRTNRLKAHDERNEAHVGDTVVVRECRPLSRDKHWRLVRVVERAR
jgi:small subunit ribosomal protein S17